MATRNDITVRSRFSSVRLKPLLNSFRRQGLLGTYRRVIKTASKELISSVPLRDRIWLSKNGFKSISYLLYGFAEKSLAERGEYLPDSSLHKQRRINYGPSVFLSNKLVFYRAIDLAEKGIIAPELVAIMIRGELLEATSPNSVISFDELSRRVRDCYLKPMSGGRGRGVRRVTDGDFAAVRELLSASTPHVIVRTVEQADYSRKIFPDASNTVRAVAMRSPGTREIFFPCVVHRFGSARTVPVDNWSRGGLSCEIDVESGVIGPGIQHPSITNGKMTRCLKHPDTGEQLDGIAIPNWPAARMLLEELMNLFPEIEFAGWDLLPTNNGWCVIEGNNTMDFDLLQVHKGILQDDRVREFAIHHQLLH